MHYGAENQAAHAPIIGETLEFDDVQVEQSGLATLHRYHGFTWDNAGVENFGQFFGEAERKSGYFTGITTGEQALYNKFAAPLSMSLPGTFDLTEFNLTAAWVKRLTVEIDGYDADGNLVHHRTVTVGHHHPRHVVLRDFDDVSQVVFTSGAYVESTRFPNRSPNFVIDSLSVADVHPARNGVSSHAFGNDTPALEHAASAPFTADGDWPAHPALV